MIILPAIDLLGGQCVRLVRGGYDTAHKVAADPIETAQAFASAGAKWLHIVDLDGARDAKKVNNELIIKIAQNVPIKCEVGGGIRDIESVDYYLSNGVSRVILGSAALKSPAFVRSAVEEFGDAVAVGIDAKDGFVSVSGWTEESEVKYTDFARMMESFGVKNIIFTDISRDGTLTGANTDMLRTLSETVGCDITASGGVKDINDIKALKKLGLYGAIAGKALYSGTLDLAEAIRVGAE